MLQLDRTSDSILNIPHYLNLLVHPYDLMKALGKHGFLHWMPDKQYLKVVYRSHTKRKLNLKNPTRYTEKLQWLKLYDRNPLYTTLVDKYAVRDYIAKRIGDEHLVPFYGIYENFDVIDWESLPQSFIMKCTHGSGFNMICIDKDSFDRGAARKQFAKWLATNYYWATREWPYKQIKPRIIVEQLLDPPPVDYKFYCFHGEPQYCRIQFIEQGEKYQHFLDMDFHDTGAKSSGYPRHPTYIPAKSRYYNQMVELARVLSEGIIHVRIDFLVTDATFYVGEFTFYTASGYSHFTPPSFDETLGDLLKLP